MHTSYKRIGVVFIACCLLLSCEDTSEKEEVVLEDFIPKAKRDYSFDEEQKDTLQKKELSIPYFAEIVEQISADSIELEEKVKSSYPERFGYSAKMSLTEQSLGGEINWYILSYEDSLLTVNAMYNWLDCFTEDCISLKLGEERALKNYGGVWMTDTLLVFFHSENVDLDKMRRKAITRYLEKNLNLYIGWKNKRKPDWILPDDQSEE